MIDYVVTVWFFAQNAGKIKPVGEKSLSPMLGKLGVVFYAVCAGNFLWFLFSSIVCLVGFCDLLGFVLGVVRVCRSRLLILNISHEMLRKSSYYDEKL